MAETGSRIPHEALISLRHRLETLPARHADRKSMIAAPVVPQPAQQKRGNRTATWPNSVAIACWR